MEYSQASAQSRRDEHSPALIRSRSDRGAGKPKKNGCGGKYTWVGQKALVDEDADLGSGELDSEDPNYDSDEEDLLLPRSHAAELQAYKQSVRGRKLLCLIFKSQPGDKASAAFGMVGLRRACSNPGLLLAAEQHVP